MAGANPRGIAWHLLNRWQAGRAAADELWERARATAELEPRDRRLVLELFFGCVRRKATLDWLVARPLGLPPQRAQIQNLLRLALYQLFFLDKIPAHAAVHETVQQAAHPGAKKFLNAVLRRACREQAALRAALQTLHEADPPAFYSHPLFLWQRWVGRCGEAGARALCDWNNTPPPISLRVNTLRTSRPRLLHELRRARVEAEPSPLHPLAARLNGAANLETLGAFQRGEFYVQDESSLAAVDALAPRPGETIADLCAAPGGKTTYMAALMENRGRILAADPSEKRLRRVVENCARLGAQIVATVKADAVEVAAQFDAESFDGVLVDAPCSNTGVLRRRADARWRVSEEAIGHHAARQLQILVAAARLVKRGGRIVYSTCSLEPEENTAVVSEFLKRAHDFTLSQSQETFPPRDGMDGGFWALLQRR